MKRNVTVEIGGQKLRLATDADENHLARLAALVNERIGELQGSAKSPASQNLMVLVALSLADDVLAADARRRSLEETTRRAVSAAIERIDRRLAAAAPPSIAPPSPAEGPPSAEP
ncbi:MAG: cell division protein ZapA [Deltaproteobacteria bacterium]|nr:cell division protein ZapA [Deltaproteobacteria bacterium]